MACLPPTPSELFDLSNQVAVVIGGTGVLCGHMALGLARAGAKVVVVGRNQDKGQQVCQAIEQAGGQAAFVAADATDRESLEALLPQTVALFGRVDTLINGSGVNAATSVFDISDDDFDRIMQTNVRGVLTASQVFAKHWIEQGQPGSIINIGSVSGIRPLSKVFTYAMSKAAVHNLTANLAREWAPNNVRVNTLVPGFFPAEQNRKILTPERTTDIMRHTPMGRFGEPDELLGALFLLASKAGSYITGTEIIVDGGFSGITI